MFTKEGFKRCYKSRSLEVEDRTSIWVLNEDTPIPKEILMSVDGDNQEHILVKPVNNVSKDIFVEVRKSESSCLAKNKVWSF